MTLEDPVEYPLPMVRQTSISEVSKMDFAEGIRSMMRQDPDVILVGEIRDHDTAEMAFRAGDDRSPGVLDSAYEFGDPVHSAPA
jgi:type IV pilus assembly protein PilB